MNKKLSLKPALLLVIIFLCISMLSFSQNKTVTGKVVDQAGNPSAGVTVTVKGSRTATQTDNAGEFKITAPDNAVLVFSAVGSVPVEQSVAGQTSVNIMLAARTSNLNEVVIVGYGTARKKDVTGSVASITAKDFNQGVITAPDQLLQNKVAGLEITNSSGQPGAAPVIKIRGNSSIRASNNPLFVVDGVPLDGGSARPNGGNAFGGSTASANPLLFINPADIAQVDVLKDASSSAIYGSRGANGVVVITTKKGTAGPMKMEAGVNYGVNVGYMKKYEVLSPSQFRSAITKYGLPATLDSGSSVDALKEITQHKLSQNYTLAFSGGNDVGKFRASFLGSRYQGFLKKTSLDKYIGTFGGVYKFLDKRLTLDFNLITADVTENITSLANNSGSTGDLISSALSWNPTVPFYQKNGLYNLNSNGIANPLAVSDAYSDVANVYTVFGNMSVAYKILNNLEYKFLYAVHNERGERLINAEGFLVGFPGTSGQGQAAILNARLTSQTFTHTLNYRTNLTKDVVLDAVAGFEYWKTDGSGRGIGASGFNTNLDQSNRISIPYTSIFQNASTQNPLFTGAGPTVEIQSQFARANFNIADRYVITGTIRRDGSSKFGANNKYGYFPSVGAKWQLSNESFLKNSTVFNNLSLRGSYGITGNQEFPAGSSLEQFNLGSFNNAGQAIVANPNLKWETTSSYNIGLDYAFAKGRVYGAIDYYNKNTKDILFQTIAIAPAPSSIYFINLPAHLINSGVEFAIGATVIQKSNITWDVNFNIAYNKNIIKKFTDINTGLPLSIQTGTIDGQGVSGTLSQVITNDQPVNEYFLKPFGGFDATGNQIIGSTPQYAGDPNPHVIAGFSTSLKYDKFTLSMNFGGAFGFLIYNNTATSATNINGITSGRNIDLQAFNSAEKPSSGAGASTRFLEKGDYVKLRNVNISYNLGNQGKYLKNITAFVSGSNLFVITKFHGFDPEVNIDKSNGAYPSRSIEYIPYPTPRSINFGFNFTL